MLQRFFGWFLCSNRHCCWNVAFNKWSIYCRSFLSWWGEAAATEGKKHTAKQQNRSAFLNPLTPHVSYTRTHSLNSVHNVNITLTQTNTGISADITLFSWQISPPPITLLFMLSAPSRPAPFTLLSAKHRRKVISLLSSCHFGTFLFRQTWAVTLGPGHMRTPLYNSLRRKQHKTANSFYTSASCPW